MDAIARFLYAEFWYVERIFYLNWLHLIFVKK